MVERLIETLNSMAGLRRSEARNVAQILLRMSRDHFSPPLARELFAAIPGGEALARSEKPAPAEESFGIEGMMSGAIRNVLGVGDPLVTALAELKAAGLNSSQALLAGKVFLQFARQAAGKDVAARMADEIPGLSRLS